MNVCRCIFHCAQIYIYVQMCIKYSLQLLYVYIQRNTIRSSAYNMISTSSMLIAECMRLYAIKLMWKLSKRFEFICCCHHVLIYWIKGLNIAIVGVLHIQLLMLLIFLNPQCTFTFLFALFMFFHLQAFTFLLFLLLFLLYVGVCVCVWVSFGWLQ